MIKHTLYVNEHGAVTYTFVEYTAKDKGIVYAKSFESECKSNFQCDAMREQYGVNTARIITPE